MEEDLLPLAKLHKVALPPKEGKLGKEAGAEGTKRDEEWKKMKQEEDDVKKAKRLLTTTVVRRGQALWGRAVAIAMHTLRTHARELLNMDCVEDELLPKTDLVVLCEPEHPQDNLPLAACLVETGASFSAALAGTSRTCWIVHAIAAQPGRGAGLLIFAALQAYAREHEATHIQVAALAFTLGYYIDKLGFQVGSEHADPKTRERGAQLCRQMQAHLAKVKDLSNCLPSKEVLATTKSLFALGLCVGQLKGTTPDITSRDKLVRCLDEGFILTKCIASAV